MANWLTLKECERIAKRQAPRGASVLLGTLLVLCLPIVVDFFQLLVNGSRERRTFAGEFALVATAVFGLLLCVSIISWRRNRQEFYRDWMRDLVAPDPKGIHFQVSPGRFFSLGDELCIGVHPTRAARIFPPFVFEVERRGPDWKLVARRASTYKKDDALQETSDFMLKDRSNAETFTIPRPHLAAVVDQLLTMTKNPSHTKVFWCDDVLDEVKAELPSARDERAERRRKVEAARAAALNRPQHPVTPRDAKPRLAKLQEAPAR